ncbi:thioredoxin domain-containing protein 6 isoform X7 [Oryctolagus cuniculus]
MGSRKKEAALQVNISTQELWEEMLSSKGLTVVDVYQGWCGPCKPAVSLFQKLRLEVGPDLLHFALAEADSLDVLNKYRGRCEPTFLFYAGGELVAVVRGANAPLLQKTILDQLEAEKQVLAEGGERKAIKDEALSDEDGCLSRGKDGRADEDVASGPSTAQRCPVTPCTEAGTGKTPTKSWPCSFPTSALQTRKPLRAARPKARWAPPRCFPPARTWPEPAFLLCGRSCPSRSAMYSEHWHFLGSAVAVDNENQQCVFSCGIKEHMGCALIFFSVSGTLQSEVPSAIVPSAIALCFRVWCHLRGRLVMWDTVPQQYICFTGAPLWSFPWELNVHTVQ